MPYVPLLRVGDAPVAQTLLLPPPDVFIVAAKWRRGGKREDNASVDAVREP